MVTEPPPTSFHFDTSAMPDERGKVTVGGDLQPGTLLAAYPRRSLSDGLARRHAGLVVARPRAVIPPDSVPVPRSLRQSQRHFSTTIDHAFDEVIRACADRGPDEYQWITEDVQAAYSELHRLGWAHSVETWAPGADGQPELVGGLYGVCVGGLFAGESMFHHRPRRVQGRVRGPRRCHRRRGAHVRAHHRRSVDDATPPTARRHRRAASRVPRAFSPGPAARPTTTVCVTWPCPCDTASGAWVWRSSSRRPVSPVRPRTAPTPWWSRPRRAPSEGSQRAHARMARNPLCRCAGGRTALAAASTGASVVGHSRGPRVRASLPTARTRWGRRRGRLHLPQRVHADVSRRPTVAGDGAPPRRKQQRILGIPGCRGARRARRHRCHHRVPARRARLRRSP